MGNALFYHLTRSPAESLLPVLIGKSLAAGWRVELRGTDPERMDQLDRHLWQGDEQRGRWGRRRLHFGAGPFRVALVEERVEASVLLVGDLSPGVLDGLDEGEEFVVDLVERHGDVGRGGWIRGPRRTCRARRGSWWRRRRTARPSSTRRRPTPGRQAE